MDVPVLRVFCFFFGGYHCAALAAVHWPAIGNVVCLYSWLRTPAEQILYPVILLARNHRLMDAIMPVAASNRVLKLAVVERAGKNKVDIASKKDKLSDSDFNLGELNSQ